MGRDTKVKREKKLEHLREVKLNRIKRSSSFKKNEERVRRYPKAAADMIMEVEEQRFTKELAIDAIMGPFYLYKDMEDFTIEELEKVIQTGNFPLALTDIGEAITHKTQRYSSNPYDEVISLTPQHAVFLVNLDESDTVLKEQFGSILRAIREAKGIKQKRFRWSSEVKQKVIELAAKGMTPKEIAFEIEEMTPGMNPHSRITKVNRYLKGRNK